VKVYRELADKWIRLSVFFVKDALACFILTKLCQARLLPEEAARPFGLGVLGFGVLSLGALYLHIIYYRRAEHDRMKK
jgi:hypothetical protein